MRFHGPFGLATGILGLLTLARLAEAGVPTASLPLDDDEPSLPPTAANAPASNAPASNASASNAAASNAPASNAAGPLSSGTTAPPPATASTPAGTVATEPAKSMSSTPSALVPTATQPATGNGRLSLQVKAAGSTVYVFAHQEDPDDIANDSALMQCSTTCSAELPLGAYTVRVVTADGAVSYTELELRSARWITVAPANQPVRDFGFATGLVGSVSTILGIALLAGAICDSCTSTARDAGAAVALGLGIPMAAVGWSLYVTQRNASVEDRILTQTGRRTLLPQGILLGAAVHF